MPFDDKITAEPSRANQDALTPKKGEPSTCAIPKKEYPNFDADKSGRRSSLAAVEEAPPLIRINASGCLSRFFKDFRFAGP